MFCICLWKNWGCKAPNFSAEMEFEQPFWQLLPQFCAVMARFTAGAMRIWPYDGCTWECAFAFGRGNCSYETLQQDDELMRYCTMWHFAIQCAKGSLNRAFIKTPSSWHIQKPPPEACCGTLATRRGRRISAGVDGRLQKTGTKVCLDGWNPPCTALLEGSAVCPDPLWWNTTTWTAGGRGACPWKRGRRCRGGLFQDVEEGTMKFKRLRLSDYCLINYI